MNDWRKDCLILIPFRLPQISFYTFSLKGFSSDSDNCPDVRIGPLVQFPHPLRAGLVLLTLLFSPIVPSSYWVLYYAIYSSPLVRYSCLLSAGVLHALLGLKVYSWCIHGEKCTPGPPTPLPSCSLVGFKFLSHFLICKSLNIMWSRFFVLLNNIHVAWDLLILSCLFIFFIKCGHVFAFIYPNILSLCSVCFLSSKYSVYPYSRKIQCSI